MKTAYSRPEYGLMMPIGRKTLIHSVLSKNDFLFNDFNANLIMYRYFCLLELISSSINRCLV